MQIFARLAATAVLAGGLVVGGSSLGGSVLGGAESAASASPLAPAAVHRPPAVRPVVQRAATRRRVVRHVVRRPVRRIVRRPVRRVVRRPVRRVVRRPVVHSPVRRVVRRPVAHRPVRVVRHRVARHAQTVAERAVSAAASRAGRPYRWVRPVRPRSTARASCSGPTRRSVSASPERHMRNTPPCVTSLVPTSGWATSCSPAALTTSGCTSATGGCGTPRTPALEYAWTGSGTGTG